MLAKKNLWSFEDQNTFFIWWLHLLNLDNVNVNVLVRLIVTTALYLSHVVCFLGNRTSGIVLWIWGCSSALVFTTQDPRIGSPFFSDFVHEVSHKVRKLTKCDFWKEVLTGQEGLKINKRIQKWGFWGFEKNICNAFICTFLLGYRSNNGVLRSCKNQMSGKNLVLE